MYSPAAAFAVQEKAIGCHCENRVHHSRRFALLMWPLAQLPFVAALPTLFRALVLAGVRLFLWWWPGGPVGGGTACAWSVPRATFTVGQDVTFVLAAMHGERTACGQGARSRPACC